MHNPPNTADLPTPEPEALAHSRALEETIRAAIDEAGGPIDFARFMEMALYQPGLGYYVAGARKFGAAGDFVTAPEISPLFSRCLARQAAQVLASIGGGEILEFGAGSGAMAADVLLELEKLGQLPDRYLIMELSPDLKRRQHDTLKQRATHLAARVEWLDQLPESAFRGVILANEVVDAMPVHLVRQNGNQWQERCVSHDATGFTWQDRPLADEQLQTTLTRLEEELDHPFSDGYLTEINLAQTGWINSLAGLLEQGVALLIDYGFPQHEYYHPDRRQGTLMCHYRHRAHADPLILAGLQDITAHVDFTALAQTAFDAGLDVLGYTSQAQFLLATGIGEQVAETDPSDTVSYLKITQQVKKLTLPNEMGELFKVLAVGRDYSSPLQGFMLQDRRHQL